MSEQKTEERICECCHQVSDHVEKRKFQPMITDSEGNKTPVPGTAVMTSKSELCDTCAEGIRLMVG